MMLTGLNQNGKWPGIGALTSPFADAAPPAYRRGPTCPGSYVATQPETARLGQLLSPCGLETGVQPSRQRRAAVSFLVDEATAPQQNHRLAAKTVLHPRWYTMDVLRAIRYEDGGEEVAAPLQGK